VRLQCSDVGAFPSVTNSRQLGAGHKVAIALCLTGIGGFVDAVGYIALFQIFTANMSGNSIHLGMYLADRDWWGFLRPACAVAAYVSAMVLTRIAVQVAGRNGIRSIASLTLAAEAALLLLFAQATPAMHLGQIVDLHSPGYFALVALLAFAMGVQTATLTQIGTLTIYTTFVTGTLTKFAESFTRALFWAYDRLRLTRQVSDIVRLVPRQQDARDTAFLASVWFCYLAGAALGTIAKYRWELRALYIPAVALVAFVVIDQLHPVGTEEEKHQQSG
jgi:uncharacterized membrane protein YoaK (UPF0700 family)